MRRQGEWLMWRQNLIQPFRRRRRHEIHPQYGLARDARVVAAAFALLSLIHATAGTRTTSRSSRCCCARATASATPRRANGCAAGGTSSRSRPSMRRLSRHPGRRSRPAVHAQPTSPDDVWWVVVRWTDAAGVRCEVYEPSDPSVPAAPPQQLRRRRRQLAAPSSRPTAGHLLTGRWLRGVVASGRRACPPRESRPGGAARPRRARRARPRGRDAIHEPSPSVFGRCQPHRQRGEIPGTPASHAHGAGLRVAPRLPVTSMPTGMGSNN